VPLRVGEAAGKLGRHNAVARQTAKWLPKMPAPGWSQSKGPFGCAGTFQDLFQLMKVYINL
jgi:hypothetical protein